MSTNAKHTALPYEPGARYSNSAYYDVATAEVIHGWQVFEQRRPDGSPTGRRSFVDSSGNLCAIELAEAKRNHVIREAAPELLEALVAMQELAALLAACCADRVDVTNDPRVAAARAAIAKATGGTA
jgi:hypothetical protein